MEYQRPAGFWIRFLANLLDGIFSFMIAFLIAVLIEDQRFFNGNGSAGMSISEDIASLIYSAIFIVIFTASKFQGSPGKMICRIQVLNKDLTRISVLKSIGRLCAYTLSALPLLIGFMMAGWNEEKKALHDMICGTRVVYRD